MSDASTDPSLTRRWLADDVAATLIGLVRSEGLGTGDKLPPITELAERLEVSRTVVREAIEQLHDRGLLGRSNGRQWELTGELPAEHRRNEPAGDQDERIHHRSLADQAADAILDTILTDDMREADPLPPSGELAERYGVSIVVIREALASLAARGILQRRQGRESLVAKPGFDVLSSILRVRAHLEGIDTDEFQDARLSLEVQAARLAAQIGDPQMKRSELEFHLEGMRRSKNARQFNEHDLQFHLTIARLSSNRAIALILEALNDVVRRSLAITYQRVQRREGPEGILRAVENHEGIAEALVAGDPEAAEDAIRRHFQFSAAR